MSREASGGIRDSSVVIRCAHSFGAALRVARRPDGEVNMADGQPDNRRSIYIQILRLNPQTMLQAFDQLLHSFASRLVNCGPSRTSMCPSNLPSRSSRRVTSMPSVWCASRPSNG